MLPKGLGFGVTGVIVTSLTGLLFGTAGITADDVIDKDEDVGLLNSEARKGLLALLLRAGEVQSPGSGRRAGPIVVLLLLEFKFPAFGMGILMTF